MKNILKYVKTETAIIKQQVAIPEILIERLKPYGTQRFLKVEAPEPNNPKSGKKAIEKDWQNHLYEPDDSSLQLHLAAGGNYGICGGKGIIFIETDTPTATEKFEHYNTLTFKSGSGRGKHFCFRSDAIDNGVILTDSGENEGNIQVRNRFVVGANCHHYSGGTYQIANDAPIQWIGKEEIDEIFKDHVHWANQKRIAVFERESTEEQERSGIVIPIEEVIDISDFHVLANGEYQGSHPIHGSETGQNFCVNKTKNLWHCFRCNSGGGALMWLAVEAGIIDCAEAQAGALTKEKFIQAVKIAQEKGYNIGLPDEDIDPDVERFFDINPITKQQKFVPAYVAKELMEENTFVTRRKDEMMFRYKPKKGIYEMFADTYIKGEVRRKLGKHTSIVRQNEVLNFIKASTYENIEEPLLELIVVKNGILNLNTTELMPFSPNHFILNALPVDYNPNADCPRFKQFISEIVHEGDAQTLKEYTGYCFYRKYHVQKALLFVGEGANGKSTFLEVLRKLLNTENVSSEPLHTLIANRFALGQLYGKLANICADLPAVALRDTGFFKQLMGDTLSAEFKFKERFNFKNYAKLLFSCNKIPHTSDETIAFWRRWIIINFPNQFTDDNPKTDKNLLEKLTTPEELSGIFNWAIEGLQTLLKQQKFTGSKTMDETREQYVRSSNPIQAFAEEMLEPSPNNVITKDELYNAFLEYCKTNNLPTTTRKSLAMALPQYVPIQASITTRLGKKVRSWNGVKLLSKKDTARMQDADALLSYTDSNTTISKEGKSVTSYP